jgi:hypothetical protein
MLRMFKLISTTIMTLRIFQKEVIHLTWQNVKRVSHSRLMENWFKRELKPNLKTKLKKFKNSRKNNPEKTNKKWIGSISWSLVKSKLPMMNLFKLTMSVFHTKEILTMSLPKTKTSSTTRDTQSLGTMKSIKKLWK